MLAWSCSVCFRIIATCIWLGRWCKGCKLPVRVTHLYGSRFERHGHRGWIKLGYKSVTKTTVGVIAGATQQDEFR